MGMLLDGRWTNDDALARDAGDGRFHRPESAFRDRVSADGSSGLPAQPGRYLLYVNLGCPWAYRTVLFRTLKGLEDVVPMAVTQPAMGPEGWRFGEGAGCVPDPVFGAEHLHEIYSAARPDYTGRVTVPVLWDRERGTIVSNESSEIIRMLGSEFDAWAKRPELDFYPKPLREEIDEINTYVYERVNNGVYRTGFARTQEAYEEAFDALFAGLDALEERLASRRFLVGDRVTEADWRLFSTLVRFDTAYYVVFRCNLRRLVDYANLWAYTRDLYQAPGVADTVDLDHIKAIYFSRLFPTLPKGPALDFREPHGREALGAGPS